LLQLQAGRLDIECRIAVIDGCQERVKFAGHDGNRWHVMALNGTDRHGCGGACKPPSQGLPHPRYTGFLPAVGNAIGQTAHLLQISAALAQQ
jgi:hypothetical protein